MLDTNILVSAVLIPHGNPARALAAWRHDEFVLVTSDEIIEELIDVLSRPRIRRRLNAEDPAGLVKDLRESADRPVPMDLAALPVRCRDPKDDKFLACALADDADYLVTGDGDLLELNGDRRLGRLQIVRVAEFLKRLQGSS